MHEVETFVSYLTLLIVLFLCNLGFLILFEKAIAKCFSREVIEATFVVVLYFHCGEVLFFILKRSFAEENVVLPISIIPSVI